MTDTPTADRVGCITPTGEIMRGHFGPCEERGHRPVYAMDGSPGTGDPCICSAHRHHSDCGRDSYSCPCSRRPDGDNTMTDDECPFCGHTNGRHARWCGQGGGS